MKPIRRLMVIVFIFVFIQSVISSYFSLFSFTFGIPSIPEEARLEWFDVFAKIQVIFNHSSPLLFFALIYFLCTPKDLFRDYKKIVVVIWVAAFVGRIAGSGLGYLLALSHEWVRTVGKSEYIEYIKGFLPGLIHLSLVSPFYTLFMSFTALTLSYIRREGQKIKDPS